MEVNSTGAFSPRTCNQKRSSPIALCCPLPSGLSASEQGSLTRRACCQWHSDREDMPLEARGRREWHTLSLLYSFSQTDLPWRVVPSQDDTHERDTENSSVSSFQHNSFWECNYFWLCRIILIKHCSSRCQTALSSGLHLQSRPHNEEAY